MSSETLNAARAHELFVYDDTTGALRCKRDRGVGAGFRRAGEPAGARDDRGYIRVWIDGRHYRAHRIVWLLAYGNFPEAEIDHINGVRGDNRLCNLRIATMPENMQNRKIHKNNTSGGTGVTFYKRVGKWVARISVNRRRICLGYFGDKAHAHQAYLNAKSQFHPFQPVPRSESL